MCAAVSAKLALLSRSSRLAQDGITDAALRKSSAKEIRRSLNGMVCLNRLRRLIITLLHQFEQHVRLGDYWVSEDQIALLVPNGLAALLAFEKAETRIEELMSELEGWQRTPDRREADRVSHPDRSKHHHEQIDAGEAQADDTGHFSSVHSPAPLH